MVLAQSLFKILKAKHPDASIDVVAPAWTEPLIKRMPDVRKAILLDAGHGEIKLSARWQLGRSLRAQHYDQAIVLPNSLKSAIVPFAAKVRRRTGYRGEWRYGLLNDVRPLDRARVYRMVDRFVALGLERDAALPADIPAPRLKPDLDHAYAALKRLRIPEPTQPVLALCPGAEYGSAKRWPAANYAHIARAQQAAGWDVWLFGSGNDAAVTAEINRLTGATCTDLAGRTALAEAIDLLALTHAVITNDSGLMHVAAALARPLVAIFGSSDPRHTPPLTPRAVVEYLALSCSPCFERECPLNHLNCLRQIAPGQVHTALSRALATQP